MTIKTNFQANTVEQNTDVLATYMPNGRLFCAKNINNSNLRKLFNGLAEEQTRTQEKVQELADELFIINTVNLIELWESALGIPDSCFSNTVSLEERRRNVIAKLALMNLNTAQDFIDLAALFGFTIRVLPGEFVTDVFPLTFPFVFFDSEREARFTLIIEFVGLDKPLNVFPLTFPFTFSNNKEELLKCLILKLRPANVHVLFRYDPIL